MSGCRSYGGFRFGSADSPRNSTGYSGGVAINSVGGALRVHCRSGTELAQCSGKFINVS